MKELNATRLKDYFDTDKLELIDVREVFEFKDGHIKGAKNIPMSLIPLRINEINFGKQVIIYCRTGSRSAMIANQLFQQGYDVYNLSGGIVQVDEDLITKA